MNFIETYEVYYFVHERMLSITLVVELVRELNPSSTRTVPSAQIYSTVRLRVSPIIPLLAS